MVLALFDFDGTITNKDSLIDFIQYAIGKTSYYRGLLVLSPMLLAFKLKLIRNDTAKEQLITYFFKGWTHSHFKEIADNYSSTEIHKIIRSNILKKLLWHQQEGHDVVVVSASIEYWLKLWCQKNSITLIATQLEVVDGNITGKFSSKNCHGAEKVKRIQRQYNLSKYQTIYAYGDSSGDKDMLAIADISYYRGKLIITK